mgnify:CR=1 FL=1
MLKRPVKSYLNMDVESKMSLSLLASLCWNAAYAILQLGLGIYHKSSWFYAMAGYYLILATMRLSLRLSLQSPDPQGRERNRTLGWKRYRLCGILLLLINSALNVMVFYIVGVGRVVRHHEITTIAMATYTFAFFTIAVVNVFKYKKYDSPTYSAAKNLSFVAAMVSMLSLENSMLATFGAEDGLAFRQTMLGLTSTALLLATTTIAIHMIAKSTRILKKT